jgi:hypothetical protein
LPRTLDETYNRIILAIPEGDAEFARKALTWLAFSERPMTINELAEAIIIKPGSRTVDLDDRFPEPDEILTICGSLVTTVTGPYSTHPGHVILAHYSVKEYLTSERVQKEMKSPFSLIAQTATSIIAEVCLTYLAFDDFCNFQRTNDTWPLKQKYPLLDYAALCWCRHVLLIADDEERKRFESVATDLLQDEGNRFHCWVWLFDGGCDPSHWGDCIYGRAGTTGSALYYFSLLGLDTAVELSINRGADVNIQGGEYVTALTAAAHGGYENIVRLLLAKGADVNVQGRYGHGHGYTSHSGYCCTALQEAIKQGHDNIACLLMDNGADVNATGSTRHGTALRIAADRDNENMVQLLLQKGANVNARTQRGTTLAAASRRGNVHLVRLLLTHGAQINVRATDRGQRSAIAAAALSGNEELVDLLVAAGGHVNARDVVIGSKREAYYCTALDEVDILNPSGGIDDAVRQRAVQLLRKHGAETVAPLAGRRN